MARLEHVHIITVREAIYPLCAAAVRDRPDITHTFVFTDMELHPNNPRDESMIRTQKEGTRDAVTKVRALSASLKIPASWSTSFPRPMPLSAMLS